MARTNFFKIFFILCLTLISIRSSAVKNPPFLDGVFYCGLKNKEDIRRVSILLNISLGFFGVHRMYLGTDPKVPVFYTLSMGGGGLLWLVDLGILIAHKDVTPYMNNPRMFMWAKKDESLPAVSE
jgi:hypothetical protein